MFPYGRHLKPISKKLRNDSTEPERILWTRLQHRQISGVQFYRQKPIGPYIVDFFAASVKLVIEVDGSQHFEFLQREQDIERDNALNQLGLEVIRFDNNQIRFEIEGVMHRIYKTVERALRRQKSP